MSAAKLDRYPFGGWHHTNDHGWLFKRSPRFTNGIYLDAGLCLRTPLTEGCDGVNNQTLPPGRSEFNVLFCNCTFNLDPLRFVQFSSGLGSTRHPQPKSYPIIALADGILKGALRDRTWTTGPYLFIWLNPITMNINTVYI